LLVTTQPHVGMTSAEVSVLLSWSGSGVGGGGS
jgi:hypothetical protein